MSRPKFNPGLKAMSLALLSTMAAVKFGQHQQRHRHHRQLHPGQSGKAAYWRTERQCRHGLWPGAFAWAKSDINGQSAVAPQTAAVDVYQLTAYGNYSVDDRTEMTARAGMGQNSSKGQRQIAFMSGTASGVPGP